MKKKNNRLKKYKNKRNKKYQGAEAQSAKDRESNEQPFTEAIEYISNYSNKINSINSSLSFLDKLQYQSSIFKSITNFQEQFSVFNQFERLLPATKLLEKTQAITDLRSSTLGLTALSNFDSVSKLTNIWSNNLNFEKQNQLIKGSLLGSSYFKGAEIPGLTQMLNAIGKTQDVITYGIQSSLIKATELNLFAEKSLFNFDWQNVGVRIGIGDVERKSLQTSFTNFSDNYASLLRSYSPDSNSIITTNPELIKLPSVEYFTSSNLIEAISTEEQVSAEEEIVKNDIQYENEYSLLQWLPKLNEGLLNMWKGAVEALSSNNADRIRHFVTSIRELYTHLFQILAPDEQIASWSKKAEDYHNGRPTRKARLSFIYRNISDEPFKKFIDKDIDATLAFIDLFQRGTHSIDPSFSDNHLITIKCKAETTLRLLLEIHFTTNN